MRLYRLGLLILIPALAGLFSVWQGRDANWDFLNYRWYNPYAFLHGRLTQDMLVAGHATFFNPVLELPFYLLATHAPGVVAGFCLAVLDGACFVPLYLLADRILLLPDTRYRSVVAFVLALAGITGGGALGQIGIVSWDMPLGILTICAMLVLLSSDQRALVASSQDARKELLLAGFLAGAAAGLKLTASIYPVGLVAGLIVAGKGTVGDRFWRVVWFCIGAGAGILLFGGFWMIRLYAAFGNPLMPFFNGVFHSNYAPAGSNRDTTFLPHSLFAIMAFPFLFSANSRLVAEYDFRDIHIVIAYGLSVLVIPILFIRSRNPLPVMAPIAAKFLITAFLGSYAAWLFLFCIYRYILPLEMLGPLVAMAAISLLPASRARQAGCGVALAIFSACFVRAGFDRLPWSGSYLQVTMPMTVPDDAMVLMTGGNPAGFIVPSLPPSVPVIRAGSTLAEGDRFGQIMDDRVREHTGPFFTILAAGDEAGNQSTLQAYGLVPDETGCKPIVSNTSVNLLLCPANRP